MKLNIRKAREKFSEVVNIAAIKGEPVILLSKNKPKAAIVSLKDLERLEKPVLEKARRRAQIDRIRKMRLIMSSKGIKADSVVMLRKLRESRIEDLSSRD